MQCILQDRIDITRMPKSGSKETFCSVADFRISNHRHRQLGQAGQHCGLTFEFHGHLWVSHRMNTVGITARTTFIVSFHPAISSSYSSN